MHFNQWRNTIFTLQIAINTHFYLELCHIHDQHFKKVH